LNIPLLNKLTSKQSKISKQLLYFVALLYSVSTGQVSAVDLFNSVRSSNYGHYSKTINSIYALAISWKYNLAYACEAIAERVQNKDTAFSQLLIKFSQIIRLGENLSQFLKQELEITRQQYIADYEKQLENIKLFTGLYSTMMSTSIFMIAASIIMGTFSGSADNNMLIVSIAAAPAGLGAFVYLMYKGFPKDGIVTNESNITKRYRSIVYPCISSSIAIALALIISNLIAPLLAISIASIPLILLGYYARKIENKVFVLNYWYPAFVRYFGEIYSTIGSLRNTLKTSLKSDFGPLNKYLRALLNRIENKVSHEDALEQLSDETGNVMINNVNIILEKSLHKGANMSIVGYVLADIMTTLNELYNRRLQIAKVFDLTLLLLHVLSLATLSLMGTLTQIFSKLFASEEIQSIMPLTVIDSALLQNILPIIVILISIINAFASKITRGGYYHTIWLSLGMFILLGALTMYVTDIFMSELMKMVLQLSPADILG
jgi:flagellar protein FlaJ